VDAQHSPADIGDMFPYVGNHFRVFPGSSITHGIRDVDHRCPGFDNLLQHLGQKGQLAAKGILRIEFHVTHIFFSMLHRRHRGLHHLLGGHFQLLRHMHRRYRDTGVNPGVFGLPQRLGAAVYIALHRPGQAAD